MRENHQDPAEQYKVDTAVETEDQPVPESGPENVDVVLTEPTDEVIVVDHPRDNEV